MRRWLTTSVLAGCALLALNGPVAAQSRSQYDEEEEADREGRFALAVGAGLVEPTNQTETYLMAALRIRVGGGRNEARSQDEGIRGYIEPEVGYWETSEEGLSGSDLLAGINLVGVVPFNAVDTFYGVGAGVHFLDAQLLDNDPTAEGSETKLGLNAHFGIDIRMTRSLSAFGVGRFDLIQGSRDTIQSKVYLGLRGRF